ncbi:Tad domain-containing protein [Sphingomonas sp.]|uniref:TadE/TadG family type IV pilus assembly protein n=1 Tax=Sphingomonas sp. TaxID=28214 RepID=UPI00286A0C89|nr:Tad domain-containing protein [Sphingomonas sp.]
MLERASRLIADRSGAVAATVGLSLFALVAVGGIAFDYARLASLDSELQDGADQAALAGASQLDQVTGSRARATAAAQALLTNRTLMANDKNASDTAITIPTVVFYATKADAEANTNPVSSDLTAKFIRVVVAARKAFYALTPVVSAFNSGDISAEAVAGLGTAICKSPPVMICNPAETGGNTSFDASTYIGKGLKLVSVGNGSGAWVPGNFGYLDSGGGSSGANGLKEALGWTTPPGNCIGGSGVNTKPGANVSVTDALNTRFDIYDSNQACQSGGSCPASINSVKDVVRSANANGGNKCRMHNQGWGEVAGTNYYALVTSATVALPTATVPAAMGHPRDMCHAVSVNGSCMGVQIGTGTWDRDAYFRTNYRRAVAGTGGAAGTRWSAADWQSNTGLSPSVAITASNYASRYRVYNWEIAHRDQVIDGVTILGPNPAGASGATKVAYGKPVCSPVEGSPVYGPGFVPGGTTPDRRRISAAVINCTANNVHGNSTNVPVEKWIELFLVEPSLNRTSGKTNAGDVYVEVIGETTLGAGATAGQVIRRDVPYLVK